MGSTPTTLTIMKKHYINLTNGIEAINEYKLSDYSFIRIQSTACEQKLWDKIILDLDYDFLMNVAIGNECVVYDYGTNKPIPRAIYQGLQFVIFVLQKLWCGQADDVYVSRRVNGTRHKVNDYFENCFRSLSDQAIKKIKYFRPFFKGKVDIHFVTKATTHDGNKTYYVQQLEESKMHK